MKRSVAMIVMTSLPSLVHPEQVGKLMYFRGPKAQVQYAPVALTSTLDCGQSFDEVSRSCTLKLTNNVSADDLAQMTEMQSDDPRLEFTPLANLRNVHEAFDKMDRDVNTQSVAFPGTLAVSESPYISVTFKRNPKTVARILAAYAKDGIGTFAAQFSFDAERTDNYLELTNATPLLDVLERTRGGIRPGDLEPELVAAIRQGSLSSNHLTEAEAVTIAYRTIVANFFQLTRDPMFYPNPNNAIEAPLVLLDETRSPVSAHCVASLVLKKGAVPKIDCGEVRR